MFAKGTAFAVEKGGAARLMVVIAGRMLGEAGFGRFSFASSLAVVLAFATDLGLTIWTTRALARSPDDRRARAGNGPAPAPLGGDRRSLLAFARRGAGRRRSRAGGGGAGARRRGAGARPLRPRARRVPRARAAGRRGQAERGDRGARHAAAASPGCWPGAGGLAALALGVMAGTLAGAAYGFVLLGRNYGPLGGAGRLDAGAAHAARGGAVLAGGRVHAGLRARRRPAAAAAVVRRRGRRLPRGRSARRGRQAAAGAADDGDVSAAGARVPRLAGGAGAHRARDRRAAAGRRPARRRAAGGRRRADRRRCCSGADFARAVPALRTLAPAVPLLFVNCGVLHFFVARDRGTLNLAFAAAMVVVNVADEPGCSIAAWAPSGAATATVVTEAMLFVVLPLRAARPAPRGRARLRGRARPLTGPAPTGPQPRPDAPRPARPGPPAPTRPAPAAQPRSRARPTSRPDRTPLPLACFFRREGCR